MTLTGAVKESIWLKGISTVSGAMLRSGAVNATTGAFIKAVPILSRRKVALRSQVRDSTSVKGLLLGYTTRFAIEGFWFQLCSISTKGLKLIFKAVVFFAKGCISKGF
ncbi:hypothetical protein Tco_1462767 [Tanacetum coccineum]